MFSPPRPDRL